MINAQKEIERIRRERLQAIQNPETKDSDNFPRDYTLLWVSFISGLFGFAAGIVFTMMLIAVYW